MGSFRFRKTFSLGSGFRFNINKRSAGISGGLPGARFSVNSDGRQTRSVGIPGTGVYYRSEKGPTKPRRKDAQLRSSASDKDNPPSTLANAEVDPKVALDAPAPVIDDAQPSSLFAAVQILKQETLEYLEAVAVACLADNEAELRRLEADEALLLVDTAQSMGDLKAAQRALKHERKALLSGKEALLSAQGRWEAVGARCEPLTQAWRDCELAFVLASEADKGEYRESVRSLLGEGETDVTLFSVGIGQIDFAEILVQSILVTDVGCLPEDATDLVKRVVHVGPKEIIGGIGLDEAIALQGSLALARAEVLLGEAI